MASTKDLKQRIKSVKSTQKITKAMKMVAASKLRRTRERLEEASPYLRKMDEMIRNISAAISFEEGDPELLVGNGRDHVHLLLLVTSDRGLCGAFNANIIKSAKRMISILKDYNKEVKIICIGRKGYESMKFAYPRYNIGLLEVENKDYVTFLDADTIAKKITLGFAENNFDVCTVFYNQFKNAITQMVISQQLIPVRIAGEMNEATESITNYEFEPSESEILNDLLPRSLSSRVYNALLESAASEQGARMTAMDNATNNASDMIRNLSLLYNRTRQAAITRELIEIISGAEAV